MTTILSFIKGIIYVDNGKVYVIHSIRSQVNKSGGNVTIETIDDFLLDRHFISLQSTKLTPQQICEYIEKNKHLKYDYIFQNCEHFAYGSINKHISPQVIFWISISVNAFFILREIVRNK